MKHKVLFICNHNSARSQMAEAFVNEIGNNHIEAESAGLEPGTLNPIVVKVMQEVGIDISSNKTKSVEDCINSGKSYDYIITVCDAASAKRCPVFPGKGTKLHFGFLDPSSFEGSDEKNLSKTRVIRDQIKEKIAQWLSEI